MPTGDITLLNTRVEQKKSDTTYQIVRRTKMNRKATLDIELAYRTDIDDGDDKVNPGSYDIGVCFMVASAATTLLTGVPLFLI